MIFSFLKKHWVLVVILAIGLFLRTYDIVDRYEFAHDGDLFSWIVKDIVVDKHLRLIGQLTTAPGIFIGPLFYYSLIPFFLLFNMDPIGAVIPVILIGMITIASYYFVFSKLFNKTTGFIGAFLQAVLLASVYFDQRIVPSTPTNLWLIWYFYCVVMVSRGKFNVLWILGLLIGLIWHIHIALLPALIAIPTALLFAKKLPPKKDILLFITTLAISSLPLFMFEVRHGFSQSQSLIQNFTSAHNAEPGGLGKLNHVFLKITHNITRLFFYPQSVPGNNKLLVLAIFASGILLVKTKLLKGKELALMYTWTLGVILFFAFSSSELSEYYFASIEIVFITFATLLLYLLYKGSSIGKFLVLGLLSLVFIKNLNFHLNEKVYQKGYNERKSLAEYITRDSREKGYPCVAVSYITSPGENVGFRYFFWLNKLHVNQPKDGGPVYSIVLPNELADGENTRQFGQIKVIPPGKVEGREEMEKNCSGENPNLTDPMFGFVK